MRWFRRDYWYPELRGFPAAEQKELLANAKERVTTRLRHSLWIVVVILAASLVTFHFKDSGAVSGWIEYLVAALLLPPVILHFVRLKRLVRRQLRKDINHDQSMGDVRLCAGCGYDLRSCLGTACSECGEWIPPRTREWIAKRNSC